VRWLLLVMVLLVFVSGCSLFDDGSKESVELLAADLEAQDYVQVLNRTVLSGKEDMDYYLSVYEYTFSGLKFYAYPDYITKTPTGEKKLVLNISNSYMLLDTEIMMQKIDKHWKFDLKLMIDYVTLRKMILYNKAEDYFNLVIDQDFETAYESMYHPRNMQSVIQDYDYILGGLYITPFISEMVFIDENTAEIPVMFSDGYREVEKNVRAYFEGYRWYFDTGSLVADKDIIDLAARGKAQKFVDSFNDRDYDSPAGLLFNEDKEAAIKNIQDVYVNITIY